MKRERSSPLVVAMEPNEREYLNAVQPLRTEFFSTSPQVSLSLNEDPRLQRRSQRNSQKPNKRRGRSRNQSRSRKRGITGLLLNCFTLGAYSWFIRKYLARSKRIDVLSRILFPFAFLVFNVVYWTMYLVPYLRVQGINVE